MTLRGKLCVLGLLGISMGCEKDDSGAVHNGLVAVIESDLAVPKDLDRVSLEVMQNEQTQALVERDLTGPEKTLPQTFPLKLQGSGDVTVTAIGYKDGTPRAQRTAIVKVPKSYVGLVRLPLNFLCEHMVTADGGSSCGEGNTCIQGLCGPAQLDNVPHYEEPKPPAYDGTQGLDGGTSACFDAQSCFAGALPVEIERESCSFRLPDDRDATSMLNVALRLPPISAGICDSASCLIVLSSGDSDGWTLQDDGRVALSTGVCESLDTLHFRVLLSRGCPTRQRSTALCASEPAGPGGVTIGVPPPSMGSACVDDGVATCGKCGVKRRACINGQQGEWSECVGERECSEGEPDRACSMMGHQTCRANCTWGECLGKVCEGSPARACGNCGIQSRDCNNGVWSDWLACVDFGECKPDAVRECGSGGFERCNAMCHWSARCEQPVCDGGPTTETCGRCGEHSRTCDALSMQWSDWSACGGEGECQKDGKMDCGNGGSRTCGGDCRWENVCRGQVCDGPTQSTCGMCGTQTRSCNMETGDWNDYGECRNQGACMANTTRPCGNMGTELCGADCQWTGICEGQECDGAPSEVCNSCGGMHSRTCNTATGRWNAWGACIDPVGSCTPGDTTECGTRGTRRCSDACRWGEVCENQVCSGTAPTRDCGCHPSTEGTCNQTTGQWSNAPACSTDPCICMGQVPTRDCVGCHPDTKGSCDEATGTWLAAPDCVVGPCECMGAPPVNNCGCHGMTVGTCDMVTGTYNRPAACPTGDCSCTSKPKPDPVSCCRQMLEAACDGGTGNWVPATCPTAPNGCTCESDTKPDDVMCCQRVIEATCNGGTGRWNTPVCDVAPGECTCDPRTVPLPLACCREMRTGRCDKTTGLWIAPTCEIPEGECMCVPDDRPDSIECCSMTIDARCNTNTGRWMAPACSTPAGRCMCDATKMPEHITCCSEDTAGRCDMTTGKWVDPVCATAPGQCECKATEPDSITCCGTTVAPSCNHDDGTWLPPTCATPAGECPCTGEKPKDVACCQDTLPVVCDGTTGQWTVPMCTTPQGECMCKGEKPEDVACCQDKLPVDCNKTTGAWTVPVCGTPQGECTCKGEKPADVACCQDTLPVDCNKTTGAWTVPVCSTLPGECKCEPDGTTGRCEVCAEGEGPLGVQSYVCDSISGAWKKSGECQYPDAEVCDPKTDTRQCSSDEAGDAGVKRYCNPERCVVRTCPFPG